MNHLRSHSRWAAIPRAFGAPIPNRSAYDKFMLRFHDYLKAQGSALRMDAGISTLEQECADEADDGGFNC